MKKNDFNELISSIDQARKIHKDKLKPGNPVAVKNIRKKLQVSQSKFAYMIGVSIDTLQNWEQGRRTPEGPALALLKVAETEPETVMKALHV